MRRLIVALLPLLLLVGCEKYRLDEEVRRLCAKDGGVKVYETVKLTPELLDRYGRITIPSIKDAKEPDEYYYTLETVYLKEGDPDMYRSNYKITRRSDGRILGESVYYARRGGDILSPPFHPSSFACPNRLDLFKKVFIH